jgi:hypothetical protein
MKRPKPDVPTVDAEQEWINKYRAAIPEPPKPLFKRMVGRLRYLGRMILGKSKKLVTRRDSTPERAQPQPLQEIGVKTTKRKRRGRSARLRVRTF